MLPAYSDRDVGPGCPRPPDGDGEQRAHALAVELGERARRKQPAFDVGGQQPALHVVAGETVGELGEVVGTEGQELRVRRQLAGQQRGPRCLHHRADAVGNVDAGAPGYVGGDGGDIGGGQRQFPRYRDERDHHLEGGAHTFGGHVDPGGEQGTDLSRIEPGTHHGEPYAAHPEHGVGLAQRRGAGGLPVVVVAVAVMGEELVHRSIQQTYRQRSISHGTQQVTEVLALRVSQGHESLALVVGILSHDDPADQRQPGTQELVFGAAQTDALGAQPDGARRVGRGIRVGPNPEPAVVVGPAEQNIELRGRGRRAHLDRPGIHLTGPPVDRNDVPLAQLPPVGADAARDRIDPQRGRATHRGPAGAAGDHSRVRGEPSARRDDGVRGQQARYVRGRRLGHHQDGGHTVRGPLDRVAAGQRDPSAGRPGGGREPAHQQRLAAAQPQLWVQQCLYLLGSYGQYRGGAVHGVGGDQVHGEPYRGGWAGVVVGSRAEQGELAVAQLEPDVRHGVEVVLEGGQRRPQEIGATGEPRHRLARPAR